MAKRNPDEVFPEWEPADGNYQKSRPINRRTRKSAERKRMNRFIGNGWYIVEVTEVDRLDTIGESYLFVSLEVKVRLGKTVIGVRVAESQPVSHDDWIQLQVESILSDVAANIENALYTY